MTEPLREQLAALQHEQWSGWMGYIFSKCEMVKGEDELTRAIIPNWAVQRWQRQSFIPYIDLPEEEKESDRIEADKYMPLIASARREGREDLLQTILDQMKTLGFATPEQRRRLEEEITRLNAGEEKDGK